MKVEIIKRIWKYSSYQFCFNFINYFSRNLDNLLIGKVMGVDTLGYYDKAYRLMLYPISILTGTISSTMHPVLSKYQDDLETIFITYIKVVKILSIIGVPLSIYLYFSSFEIINILYGGNWNQAVPIFKILSLSVCIQMILSSSGSIFQAVGKTSYLFLSGFLSSILMISAIVLGLIYKNLVILSILLVLAFIINFIQCYYIMVKKIFKKNMFDFYKELKSSILIGIITLLGYLLVLKFLIYGLFINFILKIIISIITFCIGIFITGEYKILKKGE